MTLEAINLQEGLSADLETYFRLLARTSSKSRDPTHHQHGGSDATADLHNLPISLILRTPNSANKMSDVLARKPRTNRAS